MIKNIAIATSLVCALGGVASAQSVKFNEARIDMQGADDYEFVELVGAASTSLNTYTLIVLGDINDGDAGISDSSGRIEAVVPLTGLSIAADGYFALGDTATTGVTYDATAALNFENNDNVTYLLVDGFNGALGDDVDTNDDGTLDVTPWTSIVDSFALVAASETGQVYSTTVVGPADGGYLPSHIVRCPDTSGTLVVDNAGFTSRDSDTPGAANPCTLPPDAAPVTADAATGTPDAAAGTPDAAAGTPDAPQATADAAPGTPDAAAGTPDAGTTDDDDDGGCGCRVGGRSASHGALLLGAALLGLALIRRRR